MTLKNIKPALVLCAICLVVALMLAGVNELTAPKIKADQDKAANAALLEVLPEGKNFSEITLDDSYPKAITKAYKADGGYVFQATVTGKSSGLIIMCGVSADGKIVGTKVIAEKETDDYDKNVFPKFEGLNGEYKDKTLDGFEPILVAKATLTSSAYGEAVKASLQAFVIAGGGNVDLRTPEQIINDNCNAALGTEGLTFEKWFANEIVTGIDAVYESDAGRVFIIGENYIGIKADGTVATADATEENKAAAKAANGIIGASVLTEIQAPDGIDASTVDKISMTESGNYVFELTAKGYQSLFEWGNKTPIKIKLSISSDGKIIDVVTVSQSESKGYGDACATDEYYEAYKGKGDADIKISIDVEPDYQKDLISNDNTDIGAISSATYTTYGYQRAVKAAFAAYELLKGGNQ